MEVQINVPLLLVQIPYLKNTFYIIEKKLVTNFECHTWSANGIIPVGFCCHGSKFKMTTKNTIASVSDRRPTDQILTSHHLPVKLFTVKL